MTRKKYSYGVACRCHPKAMGHYYDEITLRCKNHTPHGLRICDVSWYAQQDNPQPCIYPMDPRYASKVHEEPKPEESA